MSRFEGTYLRVGGITELGEASFLWPDDVQVTGGGYAVESERDITGRIVSSVVPGEILGLTVTSDGLHSISLELAELLMGLYERREPFDIETDYLGTSGQTLRDCVFTRRPVFRPLDDKRTRFSYDLQIRWVGETWS